jgi:hypothetical protein
MLSSSCMAVQTNALQGFVFSRFWNFDRHLVELGQGIRPIQSLYLMQVNTEKDANIHHVPSGIGNHDFSV